MKLYEFKRLDPDGRQIATWVNPDHVVTVHPWANGAAIESVNGTTYTTTPVAEAVKLLTGHFDE